MKWRTYTTYKDSGVEWLGEIPERWNVYRLRMLLRDFEGIKIGPFGSALKLEYMQDDGYKVYGQEHLINADFSLGYKYVDENKFNELIMCEILPGDLVVSMMGTTGKCQVVPEHIERGIMDSHLLRLRTNDLIFPSYLASLVDDSDYIRHQITTNGKGSIMEGLNSSIIKELLIMLPPLTEQHTIAAFLDRETSRIDELIAKKQRQIELLQEKRSALISHVVTKGLDPNVKMKDSGVEWLGEIPEHWKVKKLKHIVQDNLANGIFKKKDSFGSGVKLINVYDIYRDDFFVHSASLERVEVELSEQKKYAVFAGDIFFVRSSLKLEGVGRSVCALDIDEPTVFECHVVRTRPKRELVNPKYLIHYLNSAPTINRLVSLSNNVTMATIDQDKIKNLEIVLPPRTEQDLMMASLEQDLAFMYDLRSRILTSIEKLCEYRTALISAAVTGKIDVREEVA
ncbi:MAG TPA: restriction endonuclease subunit S [Syntrophorhabdaceae bacterium]|nr:restriction endonuclease subunit S [Syntrophorhabdaceae bacterium]